MTQKAYTREFLQGICDRLYEAGSVSQLSLDMGVPRTTLQHQVRAVKAAGLTPRNLKPAEASAAHLQIIEGLRSELDSLRTQLAQARRPHFTLRQELRGSAAKIRIVEIPDLHDSPKIPDKSRGRWIGAYVNEHKVDMLGSIGDFFTLDSINGHIPNETFNGRAKPTFLADMASGNKMLDAIDEGLNGYILEKFMKLGNHERRLYLAEDNNPAIWGMMRDELENILSNHGWKFSPYGEIQYIGGVGFVHAALNTMGKTYGGKNALPTIANDSVSDLVVGHSHRNRHHRAPKIGRDSFVNIYDIGCALPDGFVEDYAEHALTGWSYGIADMTIQHGHIRDYRFVSMAELEERYGKA
jgi:predicted MPP superfamily phosphohydrolase